MAHRLDVLIKARNWTNEETAQRAGCSSHYLSGIRNGDRPGLKLGLRLCNLFKGELTLSDLGIEIESSAVAPANDSDDGKAA